MNSTPTELYSFPRYKTVYLFILKADRVNLWNNLICPWEVSQQEHQSWFVMSCPELSRVIWADTSRVNDNFVIVFGKRVPVRPAAALNWLSATNKSSITLFSTSFPSIVWKDLIEILQCHKLLHLIHTWYTQSRERLYLSILHDLKSNEGK